MKYNCQLCDSNGDGDSNCGGDSNDSNGGGGNSNGGIPMAVVIAKKAMAVVIVKAVVTGGESNGGTGRVKQSKLSQRLQKNNTGMLAKDYRRTIILGC